MLKSNKLIIPTTAEDRIVFEYPDHQVEIEWNGSATFNVFNGGHNVNCFTDYNCKTMDQVSSEKFKCFRHHPRP